MTNLFRTFDKLIGQARKGRPRTIRDRRAKLDPPRFCGIAHAQSGDQVGKCWYALLRSLDTTFYFRWNGENGRKSDPTGYSDHSVRESCPGEYCAILFSIWHRIAIFVDSGLKRILPEPGRVVFVGRRSENNETIPKVPGRDVP